jgi:RNA polymerase sigma factor (sigma-70 family)
LAIVLSWHPANGKPAERPRREFPRLAAPKPPGGDCLGILLDCLVERAGGVESLPERVGRRLKNRNIVGQQLRAEWWLETERRRADGESRRPQPIGKQQEQIILQYLKRADGVAWGISKKIPIEFRVEAPHSGFRPPEDLIQEARLALVDGASRYDFSGPVHPWIPLSKRINGAVRDYAVAESWSEKITCKACSGDNGADGACDECRGRGYRYMRVINPYLESASAAGEEPTIQGPWRDVLDRLEIESREKRQRPRASAIPAPDWVLHWRVREAEAKRRCKAIQDMLRDLPLRQSFIIRSIHWDGLTQQAIARELNVHQGTVSRDYVKAEQWIREHLPGDLAEASVREWRYEKWEYVPVNGLTYDQWRNTLYTIANPEVEHVKWERDRKRCGREIERAARRVRAALKDAPIGGPSAPPSAVTVLPGGHFCAGGVVSFGFPSNADSPRWLKPLGWRWIWDAPKWCEWRANIDPGAIQPLQPIKANGDVSRERSGRGIEAVLSDGSSIVLDCGHEIAHSNLGRGVILHIGQLFT